MIVSVIVIVSAFLLRAGMDLNGTFIEEKGGTVTLPR